MRQLRRVTAGLILMIFMVLSLTGCGKSLEEQIAEQLELGQKYLTELNYEEAIVAFTKAIELDEKNVDAYIGCGQVYEAMAQAAGEESADGMSYYEQAAGEYEQALSLSSENPFLYDRLFTIYQITGNLEAIQKIAEKDLSGITDEEVLTELEQVKTALEVIEKIADACEAGEIDWVFEFMSSEEFAVLQQFAKELDSTVFQMENGKGFGIYAVKTHTCGDRMIYYGEYQAGLRHGHGFWIGCKGDFYLVEGEWSNDVPNGAQKEQRRLYRGCDWITIGTVQNGLWHGSALEIVEEERGNSEYPVTFEKGKYVILGTEEDYDGKIQYILSEPRTSDGVIISQYVTYEPDKVHGIEGFVP